MFRAGCLGAPTQFLAYFFFFFLPLGLSPFDLALSFFDGFTASALAFLAFSAASLAAFSRASLVFLAAFSAASFAFFACLENQLPFFFLPANV